MANRRGTGGNDVLVGTDAADTIRGLGGDDTIDPLLGADLMFGGDGDDTIFFSSVMVSNPPPEDTGAIDGGDGYDTIDLRNIAPTSIGPLDGKLGIGVGSQAFTVEGIEQILFGDRNDFITLPFITSGLEVRAGGGADYISARGDNRLSGDAGDDFMFISAASPDIRDGFVDGGEGRDTLGLNSGLTVDLADGTVRSDGGVFALRNFERISAIYDSVVLGSAERDEIFVATIFDYDTAAVRFEGRGGDDLLSGSQGRDTIDGGDGADVIRGGGKADILTGGAGRDVFVYDADDSTLAERDRIVDFKAGIDRIDLSAIDADPSTAALDRLAYIGRDAFSGGGGELRFAIVGRSTFVEVDLDGDRNADLSIALDGRIKLSKASFILASTGQMAEEIGDRIAGLAHPPPVGFDIP